MLSPPPKMKFEIEKLKVETEISVVPYCEWKLGFASNIFSMIVSSGAMMAP